MRSEAVNSELHGYATPSACPFATVGHRVALLCPDGVLASGQSGLGSVMEARKTVRWWGLDVQQLIVGSGMVEFGLDIPRFCCRVARWGSIRTGTVGTRAGVFGDAAVRLGQRGWPGSNSGEA